MIGPWRVFDSFSGYMDLKFFLEDLFGRPVDLVLADGIKPRLRKAILQEAVPSPIHRASPQGY